MKFLILIRDVIDEELPTVERPGEVRVDEIDAWVERNDAAGIRSLGDRLRPAEEGRGVTVRGGHIRVTDGPYAEAKEHVGGFDLLECRDMEHAIEVAATHPMAAAGAIEIRQLWG